MIISRILRLRATHTTKSNFPHNWIVSGWVGLIKAIWPGLFYVRSDGESELVEGVLFKGGAAREHDQG